MKIFIPTPLRQYAGRKDAVEVSAGTVGEALGKLVAPPNDNPAPPPAAPVSQLGAVK